MSNLKVCPNPYGERGICYLFDKYGDRTGCLGCPLVETIPGGVFDLGDPLPGLTRQLSGKYMVNKLRDCIQNNSELILSSGECKILLDLLDKDYQNGAGL